MQLIQKASVVLCVSAACFAYPSLTHAKTLAESLVVREQPNRVVEIGTPWGTIVAYDRGVESVWIGTKAKFLDQEQKGFPAPTYPASSAYIRNGDDIPNDPPYPQAIMLGTRFTALDVTALFDVDSKATHRPTIANDQCFVAVSWMESGDIIPYTMLVDLNTGTVTRPYANTADHSDVFFDEEFILPTRALTHRFMVIMMPKAGLLMAFAVRSIAWLSYRDHMAGHDADVSDHDAQRLLQLDPSLRHTYSEVDYDKAWFERQVAAAPVTTVVVPFTPTPQPTNTAPSPLASSQGQPTPPDAASASASPPPVPTGDWAGPIYDQRGGAGTIRLSFSDTYRPADTWSASFNNGRFNNAGALERLPGGNLDTATFYLHDESPGCPYVVHAQIVGTVMNATYSAVAGCPTNGGSFRLVSK